MTRRHSLFVTGGAGACFGNDCLGDGTACVYNGSFVDSVVYLVVGGAGVDLDDVRGLDDGAVDDGVADLEGGGSLDDVCGGGGGDVDLDVVGGLDDGAVGGGVAD